MKGSKSRDPAGSLDAVVVIPRRGDRGLTFGNDDETGWVQELLAGRIVRMSLFGFSQRQTQR